MWRSYSKSVSLHLELAIRTQNPPPGFPPPVKIGASVRWRSSDIQAFILGLPPRPRGESRSLNWPQAAPSCGRSAQAGAWPGSASQDAAWRHGLMRLKRTFEENLALAKARGQPTAALQNIGCIPTLGCATAPVGRGMPGRAQQRPQIGTVWRGPAGPRSFQQRVQKASVEGIKIIHTGPQLDQADLDVWEQALQLARTGGLGCRIQFTASQFLKSIGRGNGKSQHEWLKGAFARLAASVVEIKDGHRAYFGAILSHGGRDDQTGRYVIEMNPKLIELYGLDGWSSVEFDQRMALKKRPLAQWLHGYYSSHAKPFPSQSGNLAPVVRESEHSDQSVQTRLAFGPGKIGRSHPLALGNRCFRPGAHGQGANSEPIKTLVKARTYPRSILSYPQNYGIAPTERHGIAPTGTA
jgi:hypothetical protein